MMFICSSIANIDPWYTEDLLQYVVFDQTMMLSEESLKELISTARLQMASPATTDDSLSPPSTQVSYCPESRKTGFIRKTNHDAT